MKTLIIGIDGGTWKVILPLVKEGKLPNISYLMDKGVWGILNSTYPPITIPAWVSCFTGLNPGKFGAYYFTNCHGVDQKPIRIRDIQVKKIWEILEEFGKKSIMISGPFFSLSKTVENIININLAGIEIKEDLKIEKKIPDKLKQDMEELKKIKEKSFEYLDKIGKFYLNFIEVITSIACDMLKSFSWDLCILIFYSIDQIQHYFFGYWDSSGFFPKSEKFESLVEEAYILVDKAIGKLLNIFSLENLNLFIISDHGFSVLKKYFFVNNWLRKQGYLYLKREFELKFYSMMEILKKFGINTQNFFVKFRIPLVLRKLSPWYSIIDWNKTIAYYKPPGVNINLIGREPYGIVEKNEYSSIINNLIEKLNRVYDPLSKKKVIKKVLKKEEVYKGKYIDIAPDLLIMFSEEDYFCVETFLRSGKFIKINKNPYSTGHHSYEGILILNSPFIKKVSITNATILDITPNLLYLMKLPIPEEIDGRVWKEIIRDEFLKKNPIVITPYNLYKKILSHQRPSQDEEKEMREQLKDLGYL